MLDRLHWTFKGRPRFRNLGFLGCGRLGVVYRVHDEEMGQDLALKTLPHLEAERVYYIKEEFRSLAGLAHPNIAELYELIVEEDACFFTMELIDGPPFTEYVWAAAGHGFRPSPGGGLPDPAIQRLAAALEQLVRGMSFLHREGKLHRDIKPPNVLVTRTGRVVLLDFDMVTRFRPEEVAQREYDAFAGTPHYMALEQIWGQPLSPDADLYSVGVLLYETLAGRLPFEGTFEELVYAKQHLEPPALAGLAPGTPTALEDLALALMHPDASRRPCAEDILDTARKIGSLTAVETYGWTSISSSPPFIGRAHEMEVLHAAFDRVERGCPIVVYVEGDSGMGKTELIRRFVRSIDTDGRALVLRGTCHPQESLPYKAFDGIVDGISRYLLSLPPARLREILPERASSLVRLFPVLGCIDALATAGESSPTDARELRLLGFRALRALLTRIADHQKLILWIDDLQWGDADSVLLFRELLRPPDAPGMLLVLSYRSDDGGQTSLVRDLRSEATKAVRIHELTVGPLPSDEQIALARKLLDDSEPFATDVAEESAGSPLFLVELAKHMAESQGSGASLIPHAPRLGDILKRRIERLHDSARRVLEIVAVAGRPVERSVVFRAANVGEIGRLDVSRLTQAHLLRYAELDERPAVTTYHDRIREAVLADIPPQRITSLHLQIAEALLQQNQYEPDALVEHYLAAGRLDAAGRFAFQAAERAISALAFDRAADFYRVSLRVSSVGVPRWQVAARLAEALANAGRAREAAENFQLAADELTRDTTLGPAEIESRRLELSRGAAEQYLRSGYVEEGVAVLTRLLRAVGLEYPTSSLTALRTMLVTRQSLRWRGLSFDLRAPQSLPPQQIARMEACWSAGLGLAWVDRIRTAAFQAQYAWLALNAGTPVDVARALATEASQLASIGGARNRTESTSIIDQARRLAVDTADPKCIAFTTLMEGTMAFYGARWKQALLLCRRAEQLLRNGAGGVAWERTTSHLLSLASLVYLGDFAELGRVLPALLREADDRGDRLAASTLASGLPNMLYLAADKPGEARQVADGAMALWKQDDFQVQHYLDLVARAHIELYEGNGYGAWRRLSAAWPKVTLSFMVLVQNLRVTLVHLWARAALAAASQGGGQGRGAGTLRARLRCTRLLLAAELGARWLEGEDIPWAAALAAGLRAGIAAARGMNEKAIAELEVAERAFSGLDMALYASAARAARGTLLGGETGRTAQADGEREMHERGVHHPRRFAEMLMPGIVGGG